MDKYIVKSIITIPFDDDGNLIVTKNGKNQLDIIPQYYIGNSTEKISARIIGDYNNENIGIVLSNEIEYKQALGYYLGSLCTMPELVNTGFLKGNPNSIIDCGQLYRKIDNLQISEMKIISKYNNASFIRTGIEKSMVQNIDDNLIDNKCDIRYLIVPEYVISNNSDDLSLISVDSLNDLENQNISIKLDFVLSELHNEILQFFNKIKASTDVKRR